MDSVSVVAESLSETEIIKLVVSGKREEFRQLVEAYQNRIFGLIVRQVGDDQIAKELTQDVFLKAYLHLSGFRFQASFSTWITRIALNTTNSYFTSKRHKNQKRTVSFDMTVHDREVLNGEGGDGLDRELIENLRQGIGRLKPRYREVLVLCAFENKKYEEVATILGIPVGTVRSRLNKARLLLKDELAGCLT